MLLILEVIVGFVIAIIVLYFLWTFNKKIIDYEKTIEDGKSKVTVKANRKIRKITLTDGRGRDEVILTRENLEQGETIEFIYPLSTEKAKINVDDGKQAHSFEVEISKR